MDRIKEVLDQYRYHIMIGMVILVFIGFSLFFLSLSNGNHPTSQLSSNNFSSVSSKYNGSSTDNTFNSSSTSTISESNGLIYVDIKGAIKHPGIYHFKENTRISNVINIAGGLNKKADVRTINLAQKVIDQQVIYIPVKGEKMPTEITNAGDNTQDLSASDSNSSNQGNKINLNTADQHQMQQITGIGEKRAEQIISYRKEHGNFKQIEDLKNVNGFGDKMFENVKDSITV